MKKNFPQKNRIRVNWWEDPIRFEKMRKKVSKSLKGRSISEATKKKISFTCKRRRRSPSSEFKKGEVSRFKGRQHSKETIELFRRQRGTKEWRENISKKTKELWKDSKYRKSH